MMPRPFVRCTFAGSHETHENGPLRPRRLPVGSLPVSDGWRLCGALWRGWRIESPLGIRGGGVRSPLRWLPLACAVSACPRWLSPVLRSASADSRFGRAASGRPAEKRSGAHRQECAACRFRAVWSVVRQLPQGLRSRGLYAASRPRRRRPQIPCLWFPKLHGLPHRSRLPLIFQMSR